MKPVIGGLPNLLLSALATDLGMFTVGGSAVTEMPPWKIATLEPSERARIATQYPLHTVFSAQLETFDLGFPARNRVGLLAAVNHNLPPDEPEFPGAGQFRFVAARHSDLGLRTYADLVGPVRQPPTSSTAPTLITGNHLDVDDDPANPDGLYLIPNPTSAGWSIRMGFGVPSGTVATTPQGQCFVALVETVGWEPGANPHIAAELWNGGAFRRTLGRRFVSRPFQFVVWPWSRSEVTSVNNVEIRLFGGSAPTKSSPAYVKVHAVAWLREALAPALDSGWTSVPSLRPPWMESSISPTRGEASPTRSVHYVPPGGGWEEVIAVHLAVRSAGYAQSRTEVGRTVDPYVDLGVLCAGPAARLSRGIRAGTLRTRVVPERRGGSTEGGQSYGADAFRRRLAECDLVLTRDEVVALMDRLDWRKGEAGPFYVALEPNVDLKYQQFTSFWAIVGGTGAASPLARYRPDGEMVWSKPYSFLERL